MTASTRAGSAAPDPVNAPPADRRRGRNRRAGQRWRAAVLTPVGDGTVRRRASDVVRVVLAVAGFALLLAAIRVGTTIDHHLVDSMVPPPAGIQWLVSLIWFVGSLGVTAVLVVLALVVRRQRLLIETALAGFGTWALCGLLGAVAGTHGGRPADPDLAGFNTTFPLARIATALAIALVVLPYLSRAVHRLVWVLLAGGIGAAVLHGAGLPLDVAASLVLGWGVAAAVHVGLGTPAGLPTPTEVIDLARDLGVELAEVSPVDEQDWGVARYQGHDVAGRSVRVSVYGRDASDARALGSMWRTLWYRDTGPRLAVNRLQQVEHEAYLTLLAGRAGVADGEVLVAGQSSETGDAVLVSAPPPGRPLGELRADEVTEPLIDAIFTTLRRLRTARIAHGSISPATVVVADDDSVGLVDLRRGGAGVSDEWLDRDLANTLVTVAVVAGVDPAVAGAQRAVGPEGLAGVLAQLQPAALDHATRDGAHRHKGLLDELRRAGAAAAGVDEPQLAEIHRLSWGSVAMAAGAVVGVILIVQQFVGVSGLWATLQSAEWSWVLVAFVLAQLTNASQAGTVLGSVSTALPFGPTLGLELANAFTGLVAGTLGTTATIIRYFQRRGLAVSVAVSSGVLVTLATMATQSALFVVALCLSYSSFDFSFGQSSTSSSSSSGSSDTWILVVVVVGLAAIGAITAVPRFRRQAMAKLRPQIDAARTNLHDLRGQPAKLVSLFAYAVLTQVLFAMVLGAALHAYGASASLSELLVVNTIASLLGGLAPIPGGMGVIEAGLIAGFTALGIPNTIAVAATLTARLMTAYLPPIWGYPTLVWMRHRQYL